MKLERTRIEATDAKGRVIWDREGPMCIEWAKHVAETEFLDHGNWTLVEVFQDQDGSWQRVFEFHTPWML